LDGDDDGGDQPVLLRRSYKRCSLSERLLTSDFSRPATPLFVIELVPPPLGWLGDGNRSCRCWVWRALCAAMATEVR